MKKYDDILKKYGIDLCDEFFYILLNLISENISTVDDLISSYKKDKNFDEIRDNYSKVYYKIENFLDGLDTSKELLLHQKISEVVSYLLDNHYSTLEKKIKLYISNVLDVIFVKYGLDFSNLKSNDAIKEYLKQKFKNSNIVNPLMMILLADTSLTEEYVKSISYDEFENLLINLILLTLYLHKGKQ